MATTCHTPNNIRLKDSKDFWVVQQMYVEMVRLIWNALQRVDVEIPHTKFVAHLSQKMWCGVSAGI